MARILLVEDNEMNRDFLERYLRWVGHEVIIATNGTAAVQMATSSIPDVVIMDMSLPIMDGWEATRRLKAQPLTAAIPVLALTAHALDEDRIKSLEAGCDDYETKPVVFNRLTEKLDALMARRV